MEWSSVGGLALLPMGTLFSAVRIPERLVHAVAGSQDRAGRRVPRRRPPRRPGDLRSARAPHYALVLASTATRWRHAAAECLGRDTYLGVPRLDAVELSLQAWASYWSVPMPSAAELCSPEAVAQLVVLGSFRTAEEGPE
ncbi:hypothetical protein [Streptomyces sp. NPDC048825]|uniref:hypothetical protein n=1 Tax=Streptomyces sp. NPDC048825 TaxID=3365592 RepID=UPI0037224EB0